MNKESNGHDFAVLLQTWSRSALGSRCVRLGLVAAAGVSLALSGPEQPRAQQRYHEPAVTVTGVSSSGNVVSISADGSLNRAQTWQDAEGFHVVLVNGQAAGSTRGVRVQRVGNSLELVVPVKRGANVTVQPHGNRLDLVLTGGGALNVENFPVEQAQPERPQSRTQPAPREAAEGGAFERAPQPRAESKRRGAAEALLSEPARPALVLSAVTPPPAQTQAAPAAAQPNAQPETVSSIGPAPQEPNPQTVAQPAEVKVETEGGEGLMSYLLSLPSLLAVVGIGLAGSVGMFVRRRRSGEEEGDEGRRGETKKKKAPAAEKSNKTEKAEKAQKSFEHFKGDRRKTDVTVPFERRKAGRGAEDEATRRGRELGAEAAAGQERPAELKPHASEPSVVHGSYRIDQEVASLVAGGPHSIEVLASRASDDRRAVETSLLKALRAQETDEDGQRRARIALEDYGFVARACASLLLGGETFERVSAARALGDMKSAQALPFLTEALYDHDPLVRTECVQSLGALGLPTAIGALLDVARRHQDIPANILGPALTACSVESLELERHAPAFARGRADSRESTSDFNTRALVPATDYEDLPESCEDEALAVALVRVESTDAESRATAAQQLAQFQVRRAVAALARAARHDAEGTVRSAAVNSLGLINHESVFAHVIMALADEAREVRAAAARALSRLSFERAEAYVRVAETADPRTLGDVAHACVKAGLATQAVGRLTSEDRRQAYEAFSLLSLCASGGEPGPLLDAIGSHRDDEASLTCVQLLGDSLTAEVVERLRRLADEGGMPERVRRSILETVERAQRAQTLVVA
ncbi:MAG: HEAT repeat domain-containing protein [Acidobacteria bacterium]|nr:HEAT repeat domain-containing protein [Acidobacteriota bacterium]